MKDSRSQNNQQNKQTLGHKHRPEIRDDLDARMNEEQQTKGNSATHNKKETKEEHLKEKNKNDWE